MWHTQAHTHRNQTQVRYIFYNAAASHRLFVPAAAVYRFPCNESSAKEIMDHCTPWKSGRMITGGKGGCFFNIWNDCCYRDQILTFQMLTLGVRHVRKLKSNIFFPELFQSKMPGWSFPPLPGRFPLTILVLSCYSFSTWDVLPCLTLEIFFLEVENIMIHFIREAENKARTFMIKNFLYFDSFQTFTILKKLTCSKRLLLNSSFSSSFLKRLWVSKKSAITIECIFF